jgi:HlyD family type I secretion membrane fusion protein
MSELTQQPARGLVLPASRPVLAAPMLTALLAARKPRTGGIMAFGLFVLVVFVGGFLSWATLAPLAEAAIAPGQIRVEGMRRTIQHLEGGVIREILVRDGSRVTAGQVVIRLDDVQSGAGLDGQLAQRFALRAHIARVDSELANASEIAFPEDLLRDPDIRAVDAIAGQRALFAMRRAAQSSQLGVLEARLRQSESALRSVEALLAGTRRQLDLVRQEEAMRRGLVSQGLSRLPDLLAVQRTMASLEAAIVDYVAQLSRTEASISESQGQIRSMMDQRMQDLSQERRELTLQLAASDERMRVITDVAARREIVAPESGVISNLRVFTVGGVARPGEPLMDLVPDQDRLVAEVMVQTMDIDVVVPGLRAEIRLPAFKQRLVPFLHGHVTFVDADATQDQQSRIAFYRAQIVIEPGQLAALPGVALTPGMPVEAHIQIGQRTFWTYLTQPIRDSLSRAFTEP